MKKQLALSIFAVSTFCFFTGCHSDSSAPTTSTADAAATPTVPIPADSPFAKIKVGMSEGEVVATIGQPTSEGSYMTGKSFIPFHFSGSDDVRKAMHYKGQGLVILSNNSAYTSGYSVSEIDYNANDPGYDK
jgi:hypothetical protein